MNLITIVGMGPGGEAYLTLEAFRILTQSEIVYLRTDRHPVVEKLVNDGMKYKSFDTLYDQFDTFDEVYEAVAQEVIKLAEEKPVVFAVPGNPFVAEKSVALILERAKENIRIIHGTSFIDAIVTALRYDPVSGFVILDALSIDEERINARKDHLFIQVYDQMTASNLKLKLMETWDDRHLVTIVKGAGIPNEEIIVTLPLYELDHDASLFNHLTSLFVSAGEPIKHEIHELQEIMRLLRSEDGCPWDREQTRESLAPYLIEEAYEVRDAILNGDDESLVDELGDVLLQIVFHATIAEEDGYFDFGDIVKANCEKMIRRHPHVFGDVKVGNSEEVLVNWQAIKDDEKSLKRITDSMKSVTQSLPSLLRSQKVQKKAAEVGFDWPDAESAFEKIIEETDELKSAILNKDYDATREEIGDLLLIISNVARILKIDAELALGDAIEKFINRFAVVEEELEKDGLKPNPLILERMEQLWQVSKKRDNL